MAVIFAFEIIAFHEGVHNTGSLSPPDGISQHYGFVVGNLSILIGQSRTGLIVLLFHRGPGGFIVVVQILGSVGLLWPYFVKVSPESLGCGFCQGFRMPLTFRKSLLFIATPLFIKSLLLRVHYKSRNNFYLF